MAKLPIGLAVYDGRFLDCRVRNRTRKRVLYAVIAAVISCCNVTGKTLTGNKFRLLSMHSFLMARKRSFEIVNLSVWVWKNGFRGMEEKRKG